MLKIIVSVCLILLMLFLCYQFLFYFCIFFWLYIEHTLGSIHNPIKYKPAPLRRFVINLWVELWYQLGKYYLWPSKFLNLSLNRKQHATAVLLVHGYCRNQSDWLLFRNKLRSTGLPIYTINLTPNLAPIEKIARESLPAKIALIKQQTNCKNIILIGHSMGGLVASYYSLHLDQENLISRVITICTPFYGTRIAIAAFSPNAIQMRPGSKFVTELRHHMQHSDKQFYQIATQLDNIVFPWYSSLLLTTPESQHFVVNRASHLSVLHNKQVAKQVRAWLKE